MSWIWSRALAGALVVAVGGCKWSTSTSDPPRPSAPSGTSRLKARRAPPPVAVEVVATRDSVTVRVEGRPPFAEPPTIELGPRGAVGQPLPLGSASGGVYEGTLRGLPADGMLTASVFGRDTAGQEVRAFFQLAVAPVDPTVDGQVSSPGGELEVQLEPGTLPDGARVILAPAREPAPPVAPPSRVLVGPFAVSASDGAAPGKPVRLVFHVPQHFDVDRFDPASFTVHRWDDGAGEWRTLGGTLIDSPHDELVLLRVDSFGSYALTAKGR